MKKLVHLLAVGMGCLLVPLQAATPFAFEAPSEWRPERIPFPLGFAPELKYRGFEELRFGPGMFKPGSDTYWTYGFFWWVEGRQAITKASLEKDLLNYYRGLSRAVGGSRGLRIDPAKIGVKIETVATEKASEDRYPPGWKGTLTTYDAFVTGKLLRLHFEVSANYFETSERTWVFFCVSPHDPAAKRPADAWRILRRMRDSFRVK